MNIKNKILLAQIFSVALFAVLGVLVNVHLRAVQPQLDTIGADFDRIGGAELNLLIAAKDAQYNATQVQQWLTDISATRGLDGLDDGFSEAEAAAKRFAQNIADAKTASDQLDKKEVHLILEQLGADFPAYYQTGQKMARAYMQEGPAGGNQMMSQFDGAAEKIVEGTNQLVTLVQAIVKQDEANAVRNVHLVQKGLLFSSHLVLALSFAALISIIMIGVYLYRMISTNFQALDHDIGALEQERYDAPAHMNISKRDEFGRVARILEAVRNQLSAAKHLEAQQQLAEQRAKEQQIQARNELANRFQQRVQGIIESVAAAATQLYHTSESMSGLIGDVGTKSSSVARSSGEASLNVQTVASAAEEMTASVREIAEQIVRSTSAVKLAVDEMEKADRTAVMLEQATVKIGEAAGLIQDIAGQINLLSLNATIESARAGEAGKGFAVVAGEVKSLAGQTASATEEISNMITRIQHVSQEVLAALKAIRQTITQVDEFSSAISAAVEEQTATTNEISVSMSHAARGTTQIDQDISLVNQAASEASHAAHQVLDAATMLSRESESLSAEVDQFLAEVRAG